MKKGGKKTMTPKQIEANRNNSLKSTGPKTAEGKAKSKMNALKHGILSDEVLVRGLKIKEKPRELAGLRERFWNACEPVGVVEEMLVEQMVVCVWRKRRALVAETGEVALSVDGGWWKRDNPDIGLTCLFWQASTDVVGKMGESVLGILHLRSVFEGVREDVLRHGELTEAALKRSQERLCGRSNAITTKLAEFRAMLVENPEGLDPDALKAKHQRCVLEHIERALSSLNWTERRLQERERMEEAARQAAAVLPSAEKMDKLLRYETTMDRQFYRAMHQLERLQRMRKGENVPPPLTMEVSQRC
jgi:hypothetical protein